MSKSVPIWVVYLRLVLILSGGCLFSDQAWSGEKIQLSDEAEKQEIPGKSSLRDRDDPFSKPLEFFNSRDGGGGSLVPSLPPPIMPNKMTKEKSDDANWIFNTPETFDQEAALKEIFKIREYDPEKLDRKSKTTAERLFGIEGDRDRQSSPQNLRQKEGVLDRDQGAPWSRRKSSLSRSEEENSDSTQPIAELNLKDLLNPNRSQDHLSYFSLDINGRPINPLVGNPLLSSSLPRPVERTRQQELRLQEFEKLIGAKKLLGGPLNDPLHLQQDSTRLEINPVIGKRAEDYAVDTSRSNGSEPWGGLSSQVGGSRPRILEPFNPKVLGLSTPVMTPTLPPPTATIMQAKPPVLELPRRKF